MKWRESSRVIGGAALQQTVHFLGCCGIGRALLGGTLNTVAGPVVSNVLTLGVPLVIGAYAATEAKKHAASCHRTQAFGENKTDSCVSPQSAFARSAGLTFAAGCLATALGAPMLADRINLAASRWTGLPPSHAVAGQATGWTDATTENAIVFVTDTTRWRPNNYRAYRNERPLAGGPDIAHATLEEITPVAAAAQITAAAARQFLFGGNMKAISGEAHYPDLKRMGMMALRMPKDRLLLTASPRQTPVAVVARATP